ncbi:GtrA family protein [Oceanicoccus sp. KOV_DT_Chl]|uniref:GtrA family protein n=1 Tax=Oceanicoccus sp. KOV_DT_Chl TaxID=1904639 RepID=UPI00190E8036|nr:GtrA family protein [Oceanicoccus sp. KOV_DT_Chl]
MKSLSAQFMNKQFLKFLLAGGLAAMINFGSRFFYSQFVEFKIAVIFAFFTGLVSGYLLARYIVFEAGDHSRGKEAGYYILVNLVALAQTWLISVVLADLVLISLMGQESGEAIAHFIGVVFPVFTSFLGHKYFTFASK